MAMPINHQSKYTTCLSSLIFLVATACWIRREEDGDRDWAEVNIGAAMGHFHFERRRRRTRPYDMHDCMIACTEPLYEPARAVVERFNGVACRQRLFLYGYVVLSAYWSTVLVPTAVHPVAVVAG